MCGPIGNRLKRMPDKGWSHEFEDPISLPLPRIGVKMFLEVGSGL